METKKYIVLEQHKFSNFNDSWCVKFANLDEDKAYEKLVALLIEAIKQQQKEIEELKCQK